MFPSGLLCWCRRPPDSERREPDGFGGHFCLFGGVDVGDEHAGGPRVQDPLDGRRTQLIDPHQRQETFGCGRAHELVGGADVDGGVFLIDDDEVVAGVGEDLDGFDGGQLDPGAYGSGCVED